MKGVKVCLLGVCLGIMGLAVATNNIVSIGVTFVGFTVAVAGLCVKD